MIRFEALAVLVWIMRPERAGIITEGVARRPTRGEGRGETRRGSPDRSEGDIFSLVVLSGGMWTAPRQLKFGDVDRRKILLRSLDFTWTSIRRESGKCCGESGVR